MLHFIDMLHFNDKYSEVSFLIKLYRFEHFILFPCTGNQKTTVPCSKAAATPPAAV